LDIRHYDASVIKERTFEKKLMIENFRELKATSLNQAGKPNVGKAVKETATVTTEVFYTPAGFRCEVFMVSPIYAWDFNQACRIEGIGESHPEGDLQDKNFETALAAMHFITRRLRRLGWDPVDNWHDK